MRIWRRLCKFISNLLHRVAEITAIVLMVHFSKTVVFDFLEGNSHYEVLLVDDPGPIQFPEITVCQHTTTTTSFGIFFTNIALEDGGNDYNKTFQNFKKVLEETIINNMKCEPIGINMFSDLNMEKCNKNDSITIWNNNLSNGRFGLLQNKCASKEDCMPVCRWTEESYPMENSQTGADTTSLTINGMPEKVRETKEVLMYGWDGIIIAIGGYIGLFIGTSILDIVKWIIERGLATWKSINC
ncbi:uncharacterized protein LOC111696222 [Eurytemora carolleeae]|uniref:uncharacterized protein LOC111696222 n=1 Tax=Eurytemora carolleeae TaxID=1294199 RepID=UPI000C7762DE|nr:uncharacterized protein LOC111696222 [Eurytemora carolleeae]|eukprot:XP_023321537.1 uncharacterized protein LOC111696222 [Eurytemora affinis]